MQNSRGFQEIKRTQDSQQRRKIQEISRDYLRNATYRYLERYATSEANLRKVLLNKVARRTREVPVSPEDIQHMLQLLLCPDEFHHDSLRRAFVPIMHLRDVDQLRK